MSAPPLYYEAYAVVESGGEPLFPLVEAPPVVPVSSVGVSSPPLPLDLRNANVVVGILGPDEQLTFLVGFRAAQERGLNPAWTVGGKFESVRGDLSEVDTAIRELGTKTGLVVTRDSLLLLGIRYDSQGVRTVHDFVTLVPHDSPALRNILHGSLPSTSHVRFEKWPLNIFMSRQEEWWHENLLSLCESARDLLCSRLLLFHHASTGRFKDVTLL